WSEPLFVRYDPSLGELLLEIVVTNQDNVPNGIGAGANKADETGTVTSRAYCVTNIRCPPGPEGLVATVGNSTSPKPDRPPMNSRIHGLRPKSKTEGPLRSGCVFDLENVSAGSAGTVGNASPH